jgi:ribonuclease P protein component
MSDYSFSKSEHLKSNKTIASLFEQGTSFVNFPLRVVWMPVKSSPDSLMPLQVAFSVSKKSFKRAVDRNRIRRLLREAYRLQKHSFNIPKRSAHHAMMFIFLAKEEIPLKDLEVSMQTIAKRWKKKTISPQSTPPDGENIIH